MQAIRLPALRVWPALTAALIFGLLECAALCRSRALDAVRARRWPGFSRAGSGGDRPAAGAPGS